MNQFKEAGEIDVTEDLYFACFNFDKMKCIRKLTVNFQESTSSPTSNPTLSPAFNLSLSRILFQTSRYVNISAEAGDYEYFFSKVSTESPTLTLSTKKTANTTVSSLQIVVSSSTTSFISNIKASVNLSNKTNESGNSLIKRGCTNQSQILILTILLATYFVFSKRRSTSYSSNSSK